ncbi:MAG: hypothetical protein KC474_07315 [Cyanobacteria bacterium HKST-UBA04]|nr:hypothetical protein [Cyanobacteria bacterium HKST-UBA04]
MNPMNPAQPASGAPLAPMAPVLDELPTASGPSGSQAGQDGPSMAPPLPGSGGMEAPAFKIRVTENLYLPPAMYGVWSIHASVTETNAQPWQFMPNTTYIWSLGRYGEVVKLMNLENRAQTSIQVDKVQGNTATFHYRNRMPLYDGQRDVIEIPTLTVHEDTLEGMVDKYERYFDRNQRLAVNNHYLIRVTGTRISGGRVQFGQSASPSLEVEPLKTE